MFFWLLKYQFALNKLVLKKVKIMKNYEKLKGLVGTSNYTNLVEEFPCLIPLENTQQDLYHHGEGNVWTHTKMVCNSLVSQSYYINATEDEKFVMFYAALLHDIGKPACTKNEDGKITSVGHSRRGAIDARILLWKKEVPLLLREQIVNIIGCHQVPFFAFKQKDSSTRANRTPEYLAHELSWQMPLNLLVNVAKADMLGRIYSDKQKCLDDIELFEELAKEEGCLYQPKQFFSIATRMKYFATNGGISPNYDFYTLPGSEVIVLCGLPASGKNTWIENNAHGLKVLSYDDAKAELGLTEKDNPGTAVHMVIDRAKEMLRKKEPFVWNATHLSKQMRGKTLDLLYSYGAKVKIVYLEVPELEIKRRNSARDTTLTNSKIDEMLFRWEVPTPIESHEIVFQNNLMKKNNMKI
jgi:predicted kinase